MTPWRSEPPSKEEEAGFLHIKFTKADSTFEKWIFALDAKIIDDDWVNIPSYYRFLQVPSAMLASTESVLSTSVDSSVPRVCRKRARSMKRSSKESSKKKAKVGVEKL